MVLLTKLRKYLPIIGIILFIFIIWKIGLNDVLISLSKANPWYVMLFILFFLPIILMQIFKWVYIMRLQGINIGFIKAFKFHIVSSFLGAITPGKIGLLSKIFFLKKNTNNKSVGECASSVVLDKILDLILLFVFGFFGSILLLKRHDFDLLIIVFLVLLIFGIFLLFNKKATKFLLKWVYIYFIPKKLKETARINFHSFYDSIPKIKNLIIPFIIAILTWILIYTQAYVLAIGFNIKIPYVYFIFIISIVTLATLIPITVFGIGTREFILLMLFSSFNLNNKDILAFSITLAFFGSLVFFIGYMLYSKQVSLNLENEKEKTN